jgi:hypothetical protein
VNTRAICPDCGHLVRVDLGGRLVEHNYVKQVQGQYVTRPDCTGSGTTAPRQEETTT